MATPNLHFTLTLPGDHDAAVVDFTLHEVLSSPFKLTLTLASRSSLW